MAPSMLLKCDERLQQSYIAVCANFTYIRVQCHKRYQTPPSSSLQISPEQLYLQLAPAVRAALEANEVMTQPHNWNRK